MERREPGASPSSLFVAAINAGVGDVLRRGGEDEGAQLGGTNQRVGCPLAVISGRGQGLTCRLSSATASLTSQLAASRRRRLRLGLDRHRQARGGGARRRGKQRTAEGG
jgi:hypothetical protein